MSSRMLRAAACWCCLLFVALPVWAADDDDDIPEYQETGRVARISLIQGEVNLRRAGRSDWERARLNYPLVEGDVLSTGRGSRLEIQIEGRNFVRVAPNTVLLWVTLRDEGIALSVSEGIVTVRLRRFDKDREYFEMDAPRTTLAAERAGVYRVDAERDGRVRFTARKDGRARVYSDTSGFTLRDDKTAEFTPSGNNDGDWEFFAAAGREDFWDEWERERDQYVTAHYRYYDDNRYPSGVWGGEELDAYGAWVQHDTYGWIWRPHRQHISIYRDWTPYRYGRWVLVPPYGWTWVGDEPWGWTPYHYGRWVYWQNDWCWTPYIGYSWSYYRWRPALVAVVYVSERACWYPLRWGQRDPRGRQGHRARPLGPNEIADLDGLPGRGVSTIRVRDFGREGGSIEPANGELAKHALLGRPIRDGGPPSNTGDGNRARNGGADIDGSSGGRRTGAGDRQPGPPLGDRLYKTRIYGGREPANNGNGADVDGASGGAVRRRPPSDTPPGRTIERDGGPIRSDEKPVYTGPPRVRPPNGDTGNSTPPRPDNDGNSNGNKPGTSPRPRPVAPPRDSGGADTDGAGGSPRRNPPPAPRPEPPRSEPPKPKFEPPPKVDSPKPKYEPPPRSEPPRPAPKSEPKPDTPRPSPKKSPDDPRN